MNRLLEILGPEAVKILTAEIHRYLGRITPLLWYIYALIFLGLIACEIWIVRRTGKRLPDAVIEVLTNWYFLTVIMITFGTRMPDPRISYDLRPLGSYYRAINSGSFQDVFEIMCNILLFVPFGILVPLWTGKTRDTRIGFFGVLRYGFCFSFAVEAVQFVIKMGSFETDDLINNTAGALIGYCIYFIFWGIFDLCSKLLNGKTTERSNF